MRTRSPSRPTEARCSPRSGRGCSSGSASRTAPSRTGSRSTPRPTLPQALMYAGSWRGDRIVANSDGGLVVLNVRGGLHVETVFATPAFPHGIAEPVFTDDTHVEGWADVAKPTRDDRWHGRARVRQRARRLRSRQPASAPSARPTRRASGRAGSRIRADERSVHDEGTAPTPRHGRRARCDAPARRRPRTSTTSARR